MKKIAIIGGGPAGMLAAIEAAQAGADVHLLEANPKPGKKLLVTGSGRCNISNMSAELSCYDCDDHEVMHSILNQLPPEAFRSRLEQMGIFTTSTSDGWVYPVSMSASNVLQLLEAAMLRAGVQLHYAAAVHQIAREKGHFKLLHQRFDAPQTADLICIACGGKAMPDLGSNGKLIPVLETLGHHPLPMQPALAPILYEDKTLRSLDGVRLDVEVSLWKGDTCLKQYSGNVIFTSWGINGPAVMNLSYLLSEYALENLELRINFLHQYSEIAQHYLRQTQEEQANLPTLLGGFLSQKIVTALCKKINLAADQSRRDIPDAQLEKLLRLLTQYRVHPQGTRGFKYAQLSSGGIPLKEVLPYTLESRIQKDLYFAGEILNVIGPCGGFNLHWAFASGYAAGRAMAFAAAA